MVLPATSKAIEARFRNVERTLDALAIDCVAQIRAAGVTVVDESNRAGFDWAGPYYVWGYLFDDVKESNGLLERVAVRVKYLEPWEPGAEVRVEVRRRAEVFSIGQSSQWHDDTLEFLSLEELEQRGMSAVVTQELAAGRRAIAYRKDAG